MSFLKELEKKKEALKKVEAPIEQKHTDKLLFENDDDYFRLVKETNFENYYDLTKEFILKSVIINLSKDELKSLHEENVKYGNNPTDISTQTFPPLKSIENKIDDGIKSIREKKIENHACIIHIDI